MIFDTLLVSIKSAPYDEATQHEEEASNTDASKEDGEDWEDADEEDYDEEEEAEFGIQTAPAEPPVPEATQPPSPVEDPNAGVHIPGPGEEHEPTLEDILMTHGPIIMPTALPALPITGLQVASTAPAAVASQQPVPAPHRPFHDEPGAVDGECRLLGPFALVAVSYTHLTLPTKRIV